MTVDEFLLKKLDNKYNNYYLAFANLYEYGGAMFTTPLFELMLFGVLLGSFFSESFHVIPIALMWLYILFKAYRGIKYLPIKNNLLKEIRTIESELYNSSGLSYCGCDTGGHFINKNTQQLYNIKSDILFDNHSLEKFKKWYSYYSYNIKWIEKYYFRLVFFFTTINLPLTIYAFIQSTNI